MAMTNALLMVSLISFLLLLAVGQLEDQILSSPLLRILVQLGAFGVMCLATLVSSVLYVWQTWLRWTVKVSNGPSADDAFADVVGIHLDPAKGLIMDVLDDGRIIKTLVNPNYWQYLPSSALSRKDGLESAVLGSILTNVKPDGEPASLVAISNGTTVVGMGSRVKFLGKTYLLTANHVWNGNAEKLYLAKGGIQTEVSLLAPIRFGCLDPKVDFVMIDVPEKIWARLGVKSAPLSIMAKQSMITVYGGHDTLKLTCSSGRANKGEYSHEIIHTCTTASGWSGSPLYYKGAVVGIHCGSKQFGESNRGVNVGVLLSNGLETVYSEITNTLIDQDEALDRDYPFYEVDIIGRGKIGIGKGEYFMPKTSSALDPRIPVSQWEQDRTTRGKALWSRDYDDDEPDYDVIKRNYGYETIQSHLNCQRAEMRKRSPPSSLLETINGTVETSSPAKACHCTELADRVCNLEKLVEKLLVLQSSPQSRSSQNSEISTGPSEVPKPNIDPLSSRPEGSRRRRNRKRSAKPAQGSAESTLSLKPGNASEGKIGTTATSRRKLRRSAKATSTSKPPPVSHSVSSDKQTARS